MGAAFVLVLRPTAADAQLDAFVQSVRELAAAVAQGEPTRTDNVRATAGRMRTALEARAIREHVGTDSRRAYDLHVELGVTYRARGRHADAMREFDAAAALRPSAADLQVLRALTLEALGRTGEAARAFRTAWLSDARDPVKAYYVATRPGLGNDSDRARARGMLTETYRRMAPGASRPDAAPFLLLDVITDDLSRAPVAADEATAEGFAFLSAGRYEEGAAALERTARAKPVESGNSARAHLARGQREEAEGRVASARREYQAALTGVLIGRSIVLVGIGRLSQVEGDTAGAIEAFARAARLDPNNANLRRELAGAYAAGGREDDAFGELIAALLIDSRDGQAHVSIGQLDLDAGRNAEAVTAFNRALEAMPDRYETRYALATAYTRLGRTADAAREFELFERARREKLEERRRDIAREVEQQQRRDESPGTPVPNPGGR
jgi:tetratricopeptide (TPR) repeat protein